MKMVRIAVKNPVLAWIALVLVFLFGRVAFAADSIAPAPAAAVAPKPAPAVAPIPAIAPTFVHYSLRNLQPLGISQYAVPHRNAQREYIHFKNENGRHTFIYEEQSGTEPNIGVRHLREWVGKWDILCSFEMSCRTAAFCTTGCKNLYYEISNTPEDLELLERNQCTVVTYRCLKAGVAEVGKGVQ